MVTASLYEWCLWGAFLLFALTSLYLTHQKNKDGHALELLGSNGRKQLLTRVEQLTEITFLIVFTGYVGWSVRQLLLPSPGNRPTDTLFWGLVFFLPGIIAICARQIFALWALREWRRRYRARRDQRERQQERLGEAEYRGNGGTEESNV